MFSLRKYTSLQFRLDLGFKSATVLWQKMLTGHRGHLFLESTE